MKKTHRLTTFLALGCLASIGCRSHSAGLREPAPGRGFAGSGGEYESRRRSPPATGRGGRYMGFAEKFNRYYTDRGWKAETTTYVSPRGGGSGNSRDSPAGVTSALAAVRPGTVIVFLPGRYSGCYQIDAEHGGTYDNPIVLYGERNPDGSLGARIECCSTGSKRCFNLEAADYVAIDGFELIGGIYGIRAVGEGFAANKHQKGVAVLDCVGHGQHRDPFFTGQSDWFVIEGCTAYDVGKGDGHGIYLSNGSDWNIARNNETYNTIASDFQINADPLFTCADQGLDYGDPECHAVAGTSPTGGRGASDFMLVDGNFFHDSKAQGPNFASVRNSVVCNNIFAFPARHGASFYQETKEPKLGSSNNLIAQNLFVTSVEEKRLLSVLGNSTHNRIENNVLVAVKIDGSTVKVSPNGDLLATDASTIRANAFDHNAWISGHFGATDESAAYSPGATEYRLATFDPSWFVAFPTALGHDPSAFAPSATAPWLDRGSLVVEIPTDRNGNIRHAPVDLGPYER